LLVEDTTDHPVAADGQFRSGISVPIGDHGNFQAVAEEPAAFDREDLELAELLVDRARSALDRVERERELRRENERLDEFASVVSHDLRNPLEVAIGRTELLDPEVDDEHRQEIADALDRMATIVDDTLTLARHGETVGETDPVSLPALVERCWATVDAPAASYVVDDLVVRADDDRLRHVFENLFDNAVTHGGPTVTVRVGELETGFYVADDGPGIPPDEREAVFEPGHTAAEGGTGFGLTIVHRIAGAHGWAVDVTESADGGARFEFTGVEVLERPGAGRAGNDGA
jgi:signal transduction histidine kinase